MTIQSLKESFLRIEREITVAGAETRSQLIALCGIVRGKFIAKRITETFDALCADGLHAQRLGR